jgi:biotin transporter BioY
MISPSKIFLEALLLVVVIVLVLRQRKSTHRKFVLVFTAICLVLNILFYYLAAWPLYLSYGESERLPIFNLQLLVWFDIVKWGLLAYFISRFVVIAQDEQPLPGFELLRNRYKPWVIVSAGVVGGLLTTALFYSVSYAEQYAGILDVVPWSYLKGNDLYIKLGLWGGLRNLAGEEILTRLGVQTVILYLLAGYRWAPVAAILVSSLYFECWHNGFRDLMFLNFTASVGFGIVYQKFGYESAAISHGVSDCLALVIVPRVLF